MSTDQYGIGAALKNNNNEVMRIEDSLGPVTLVTKNMGDTNSVVVSAFKVSDGSRVALAGETAVTDEDTGYDGDTAELNFSGEALNNTPIVPGSVTITPTAGGDSVDAVDTNGDGLLYTDDEDADLCGTINYATGDLVLSYPAGKAPNTTNITADYSYGKEVKPYGISTEQLQANPPSENYIIKATGLGGSSQVKVEAFITF